MHESDNDARTGVADSMTKRNSAAKVVHQNSKMGEFDETYPLTLILAGSILQTFSAIRTTTEKASFSSNWAMSFTVRLAFCRAMGRAFVGASGKSMGSTPASAQAEKELKFWSGCQDRGDIQIT